MDNKLLRMLFVSVAVVIALTPFKADRRGLLYFAWHLAAAFGLHFIAVAVFVLPVRGLGLSFRILMIGEIIQPLSVTAVYAALFCRRQALGACIVAASSIATATVQMVEFCYSCGALIDMHVNGLTLPFLLVTYALIVGFAFFMRKYSVLRFGSIPRSGLVLILVINIAAICFTFFTELMSTSIINTADAPGNYDNRFGIMSSVIFFILYFFSVMSYVVTYMMYRERETVVESRLENNMIRATNDQIELTKNSMNDIRRIRHDMANQFTYMSVLLNEGRYGELRKVFDDFSMYSLNPPSFIDCGNIEIGTILNMESSKASGKGYKLDCIVAVPPSLPHSPADLCAIICNLIDNAIEANERYGIDDPIEVKICIRNDYLYICVKNSIPDSADKKEVLCLCTQKSKNAEDHGFGCKIIARLSEKYNGHCLFDMEGGKFIGEVMLDMMEPDADDDAGKEEGTT